MDFSKSLMNKRAATCLFFLSVEAAAAGLDISSFISLKRKESAAGELSFHHSTIPLNVAMNLDRL